MCQVNNCIYVHTCPHAHYSCSDRDCYELNESNDQWVCTECSAPCKLTVGEREFVPSTCPFDSVNVKWRKE